mmetsp:Transcript_34814/g.96160  ORF Transcript_34814/g.96160 Transcript_34814/m.96160 type:complete len:160 (-) Transcript_34814:97-576(-)
MSKLCTCIEAAHDGDLEALAEVLGKASKKDPLSEMLKEVGGVYGWTALSAAAYNNHKDVVSALLDAGADPNLSDDDGDHYPLHWAKRTECAKLLIDAGANPSVRNRRGMTPLEVARQENNEAVAKVLKDGVDNPRTPWEPPSAPKLPQVTGGGKRGARV